MFHEFFHAESISKTLFKIVSLFLMHQKTTLKRFILSLSCFMLVATVPNNKERLQVSKYAVKKKKIRELFTIKSRLDKQ